MRNTNLFKLWLPRCDKRREQDHKENFITVTSFEASKVGKMKVSFKA